QAAVGALRFAEFHGQLEFDLLDFELEFLVGGESGDLELASDLGQGRAERDRFHSTTLASATAAGVPRRCREADRDGRRGGSSAAVYSGRRATVSRWPPAPRRDGSDSITRSPSMRCSYASSSSRIFSSSRM